MITEEAKQVLSEQLAQYSQRSYAELVALIGQQGTREVSSESGQVFLVDIQVSWDGEPNQDIRVNGAIDVGLITGFTPICEEFVMHPDGTFVVE